MKLTFGDGTDSDTWHTVFGGLIGYTLRVTYTAPGEDPYTAEGELAKLTAGPGQFAGMVLRGLDGNGYVLVAYWDEIDEVVIY